MMRIFPIVVSTIFFALCLLSNLVIGQVTEKYYLIKAGQMYDSEKNVFVKDQQILIKGDRIVKVGQKVDAPKDAIVLDYKNATVTPGLVDAHTHLLFVQKGSENLVIDGIMNSSESRVLRAAGFAKSYLDAGFTTIRDLGNSGQYLDVEVARAIRKGYIPGPRMYVSGPIISALDGQFSYLPFKEMEKMTKAEYRVVNGKQDAELAVKEHANNGVNVIKIVAFGERLGLGDEEMKAIVQAAHDRGLTVTAHATGGSIIDKAIRAGVDGIEHAYYIPDSTLSLMAKKEIYLVPTDPSVQSIIYNQEASKTEIYTPEAIRKELEPVRDRLMRAVKAGVMLVAGSDAYFDLKVSRGNAAKETLIAYLEEGLSVNEILKAATYNASIALGMKNKIGVIKENAFADISIFEGDMQKDFKKSLFDVKMVMKDGVVQYQK